MSDTFQATLDRIPSHLRQHVVEQDYDAYDDIDQAVWRFVLTQTFNQLKDTAHPSYVDGLAQTGIHIDRIPKIEEMNDCLAEFGWGAVNVDGFIPPRAFQEFQSLRILTIATGIRTADHLAYTPAPDIIHESAGHAPIIPDPVYREYLRRFGELSKLAFSSREDLEVYEAIRLLSIVKEDPDSDHGQIAAVEARLQKAIDGVTFTSEAALMSRLHWWTVEYGLVGKPSDYKIYGAGILSSVGESLLLHLPEVKKRRLRARCVETDYDITEPQPQLFVAEDFSQLHDILDQVTADFSFNVGGRLAIQRMIASGEVGAVTLNNGLQISGVLEASIGDGAFLQFSGPCALSCQNAQLAGHGRDTHGDGFGMPLGMLEGGVALSELTEYGLDRLGYNGPGSTIELRYKSGVRVTGNLERFVTSESGCLLALTLSNGRARLGDRLLAPPDQRELHIGAGESVRAAAAGPADLSYWPSGDFSSKRTPQKKRYDDRERQLLNLYREIGSPRVQQEPEVGLPAFEKAADALERTFPDHWLLAWNICECLTRMDRGVRIAARLKTFMKEIEEKRPREVPITVGLKYLGLA